MSNETEEHSNNIEDRKIESGFDKSLKGEQSFPPKLFRVNVIEGFGDVNFEKEIKNEQS